MIRVAEIYRYPVKSLLGERLMATRLDPMGIIGDRAWALKDEQRGGLTGAKRFPALMTMSARFVREPTPEERSPDVQIRDQHGNEFTSGGPDADACFSQALGNPVSLWPLLPADNAEHYRRQPDTTGADPRVALREMFARAPDEPLPDVSRFPPLLATHYTPPGTYFDAFPLLILTRSSLRALQQRASAAGIDANFDVRRFRPNLLLESDQQGFIENAWSGRRLRVGGTVLSLEMAC
ncbi:MAG: MOSC N-terminal beta barrel domain-containing protein, partial [Pseudomonadales bacterium]